MTNDDGGRLVRTDVAGLIVKGIPLIGGTLVLTRDELIFVPLISRDSLSLSSRAAGLSKKVHNWSVHPRRS